MGSPSDESPTEDSDSSSNVPTEDVTASQAPASPSPSAGGTGSPPPGRSSNSEFPLEASLDKTCVMRGDVMRISIVTVPGSSVAYNAVYAGEEGGGNPPFGEGHGGNDGDLVDSEGRYSSSWVVGGSAPLGPARVDVVASDGNSIRQLELGFEVVGVASGGCP